MSVSGFKLTTFPTAGGLGYTPRPGLLVPHQRPPPPWCQHEIGRYLHHWIKFTAALRGHAVHLSMDHPNCNAECLLVIIYFFLAFVLTKLLILKTLLICFIIFLLYTIFLLVRVRYQTVLFRLHLQTRVLLQGPQPVEPPSETRGWRRRLCLGSLHHHQGQPCPQLPHRRPLQPLQRGGTLWKHRVTLEG